jgi:CDP-paratose 2-epimerase
MGRILITGGLGFIGSNLSQFLLSTSDYEIIIYDNMSRKNVSKNRDWLREHNGTNRLKIVKGDLGDFEGLKKSARDVEKIYHIAGQVAVTNSVLDPIIDFRTNAWGTLNVLEVARQLNTDPSLILTSTSKVYGALEDIKIVEKKFRYDFENCSYGISEDMKIDPNSPYGCSKFCADAYFQDYYRIYGLKTVVFRMSCIYGYRQFGTEDQGWIAHFIISSLFNKKLTIYGDGKQIRDILFIQDLVNGFQMASKNISTTKGQVYNIGGGPKNTISLLELIELVETLLNRKINYGYNDWRPGDQKVYYSNTAKASRDFGWEPEISKEEGVKNLFEWVSNNRQLFK